MRRYVAAAVIAGGILTASAAHGQVCNLKVLTDASPDYSDLPSMVRSITGRWRTPREKCWAMFYWNHIARRQTTPMDVHGLAVTDPIRQFNDYGYMMCSTIAGANCSIWDAMGWKVRYWDIHAHTVSEVFYEGRWHVYDNSMSALYTLCDGRTIAGVEDVGKEGACAASGGRREPGHVARYHCLTATSHNGFLTGADCPRDLAQEYRCFHPKALKHRYYFHDWDRGHRSVLNLRDGEAYERHYHSLGTQPRYYVANRGKDPESPNVRYRIRGNGVRTYTPDLTKEGLPGSAHAMRNVEAVTPAGVRPARAGEGGEVIFKVEGANVITALGIRAAFHRKSRPDVTEIAVSATNGLTWTDVWKSEAAGPAEADVDLVGPVNGSYEVLVKVKLCGQSSAEDARLRRIELHTTTMLNSKTQPKLLLGRNTVYVGAGEQLESIVLWPDLRGDAYKPHVIDERNIATRKDHPGYMGVMHAAEANREAYVVFRLDAPREIRRVIYGGRLYNRAPKSHIDMLHSFDGGKTWKQTYSLTDTKPPWDVIHYETVDDVPAGTKSALFKYRFNSSAAGTNACSIYAVRMEARHEPADRSVRPVEVTFNWSERQEDYSLVERSHTQLAAKLPCRYAINVGGADHPVVNWLRVRRGRGGQNVKAGYSDGKDAGGRKFVHRWVSYGRNLAEGRPYTVSVPSGTQWGSGDPKGVKLTDGIVGPPYAGGIGPRYGLTWSKGQSPLVTVDLGKPQACGAFRIHLSAGWPWWDALKGQVEDTVEVLTSEDGKTYSSRGSFDFDLRWKDIPLNHMMPDDETATGYVFALVPPKPIRARYVRFRILAKRTVAVSEIQVLEGIRYDPFDLRIALPDDARPGRG